MKKIIPIIIVLGICLIFLPKALADLNDGLIAYYPFNGNAADESGNGYDGIIHGDTSLCEDRLGNSNSAYCFDGNGDYIEIGQEPDFPSWANYALSVWFLNDGGGDNTNSYGQKIIDKTVFWHDFYLRVYTNVSAPEYLGNLSYITYESGGGGINDSSHDYRDNQWHHVVINKSDSYGELWVDGNLIGTSNNIKTVYSSGKLLIGYSLSSDHYQRRYWSGKIDDIRIYNRTLSESVIWQLSSVDTDGDGIPDDSDNCVEDPNPVQSNIDADDFGDICDPCPADALDECDPDGSTAEEVPADQGGTVETPDEALTIDVEPGDLTEDTTISVTQTIPQDPEVDITVGLNRGLGQAIAVYDLQPDGLQFSNPVTLTIVVDVTSLNANQRNRLNLYLYDEVEEAFVPIPGTAVEFPPGTDTAILTAEVYHFSIFAGVAPLDSDYDGVPDLFGDLIDLCSVGPLVVDGFMPPLASLVPESEEPPLPPKAFKQGRTLPLKLQLLCGGVAYGDSDVSSPEISELTRTGEAINLEIIDPDAGQANDDGTLFRYSEEEIWVYNLKTTDLSSGTYEIDIKTPEGLHLKAGFVLR